MEVEFVILIIFFIGLIVLFICHLYEPNNVDQAGGEYVSYQQQTPDNSRRLYPLGYLSDMGYIPPEDPIGPVRHSKPTQAHPHDAVNTNNLVDKREQKAYSDYYYKDQFNPMPYDWRQYPWRPYWLRRSYLYPSAKDCSEYATDNCIGIGVSDYQSCYDDEYKNCPFTKPKPQND